MYRCSQCNRDFPFFRVSGQCPLCGVRAGVRCAACQFSSAADEFIANRNACPKCGTVVFDQDASHPFACGVCYDTTMRVQRRSLQLAVYWLTGLALGQNGEARPEELSLCAPVPACRAMVCEAPICRDASAQDTVLPLIANYFRLGMEDAVEVRAALLQAGINWCMNEAVMGAEEFLRVSGTAVHAGLIANNALAVQRLSPAVHHHGDPVEASHYSLHFLRSALSANNPAGSELEVGDLIAVHLLQRGLMTGGCTEAGGPLWAELRQRDVIERAAEGYFVEGEEALAAEAARVASILYRVAQSNSGYLVLGRISRDLGQALSRETGDYPAGLDLLRTDLRLLPTAGLFAALGRGLLERDETEDAKTGLQLVTRMVHELLYLFPTGPVNSSRCDRPDNILQVTEKTRQWQIDRSPVWELLSYEDGIGSMPGLLARIMRGAADVRYRQTEWTGDDAIILNRFAEMARTWIGRSPIGSPSWQLFIIRFTRELCEFPSASSRLSPGLEFNFAGLCRLSERIAISHSKAQQGLGYVIRTEAGDLRAHPNFVQTSLTLSEARTNPYARFGSRPKPPSSPSGLDFYLGHLISRGWFFLEQPAESSAPPVPVSQTLAPTVEIQGNETSKAVIRKAQPRPAVRKQRSLKKPTD